jgi:peptide/nickel transport system substrate-binding protein
MKRKAIAFLGLVVASSVLLSACGQKPVDGPGTPGANKPDKKVSETIKAADPAKLPEVAKNRKDTLIVGTTAPSGKFNPIYSDSVYDGWVSDLVFNGLVTNDKEGAPEALVAKEWKISDDGKTYTFTLREGVKFSNGEELTAEDVKFTFTAIADPKYDGPRADAVEGLVGYDEYKNGDATEISGIKVDGKYKISFTLKEVKAPAIYDFTYGIMPKSVYAFEKGDIQKVKDLLLKPVGSGPYKLTDYKPGQEVVFEKNENYWRGAPKINRVIMKVTNAQTNIQELQAGGVDIDRIAANPQNIQMLKDAGFLDLQLFLANSYGYIGWNLRDPLFKDKNIRHALMYGLNRKGFVDAYFKGYAEPCNAPVSPVSWAYTEEVNQYPYDKEKANKLLDDAGWKKEADGWRYKDGKKFTVNWMTYTGSKYVDALIPIMQENWKEIGVEVVPELMEFATLAEKVYDKQEFQMYNMAWSLSIDPDPSGIFGKSQAELGGFNSVGWLDPKSEELMQKGLKETNQEERAKIYKEWVKLANDELPYLFLSQSKDMYAVSSRVSGIEFSAYRTWVYDVWKAELAQ